MDEQPETLAHLQAVIDRSAATAGAVMRQTFAADGWRMSAEEFVRFWDRRPMAAVSTATRGADVHSAPLEISLVDGVFQIPTYAESVRLRDHRANPPCAITSWEGPYIAVIVYGRALAPPFAAGAGMVTVQLTPTSIYAIRPPEGHPARGQWEAIAAGPG